MGERKDQQEGRREDDPVRRRFAEAAAVGANLALYLVELDHVPSVAEFWGPDVASAVSAAFTDRVAGVLPVEEPPISRGAGRLLALRRPVAPNDALAFAQRLRSRVADRPFEVPDGRDAVFMTASIGVALFPAPDVDSFAKLESAALAALDEAKRAGGNRVALAGQASGAE